jgi:asparagine synthetase B (glutamine-hydrolysing)
MGPVGLMPLLGRIVASQTVNRDVALLLSGGIDSYSVGVACEREGKRVVAYTYELEGIPSADRTKAETLARRRGWPLKVVIVPTGDIARDFFRLIGVWGCRKKTHVEVMFPMMYVLPAIGEQDVFTGWNADDHYTNTAEDQRKLAVLRRNGATALGLIAAFDDLRRSRYAAHDASESQDTFWIASRIASAARKRLLDPYTNDDIRQFFSL